MRRPKARPVRKRPDDIPPVPEVRPGGTGPARPEATPQAEQAEDPAEEVIRRMVEAAYT